MEASQEQALHIDVGQDGLDQREGEDLLAAFCFSSDTHVRTDSAVIDLCLPPLGISQLIESWTTPYPVKHRRSGRVRISEGHEHAFAVIQLREAYPADLRSLTFEAYTEMLSAIQSTNCPHIIKIWNYFDRINEEEGGLERYRQFSWARSDAFERMNVSDDDLPTGTAIGTQGGNTLSLIALLSRHRLQRFENPRQVSAYRYPEQYGPRSPKFSRAGLVESENQNIFIVSGTAAVIGHQSVHPFDLASQTDVTFNNLSLLTQVAESFKREKITPKLDENSALRVYLRNPADYPYVEAQLRAKLKGSPTNVAFLHGDICRSELEIEIDGVRIN